MAAPGNNQNGNAQGFSGISTLLFDIEDQAPPSNPAQQVPPQPSAPPQHQPATTHFAATPTATPQAPQEMAKRASAGSKGYWAGGLILAIIIVIFTPIFTEFPRWFEAPVEQSDAPNAPGNQQANPAPVSPNPQPVEKAKAKKRPATQSFEALGQKLRFANPRGYCSLGKSAREVALTDKIRGSSQDKLRLVHVACRCSELREIKSGRANGMDHWIVILLQSKGGKFQRIDSSREDFLAAVARESPQEDRDEIKNIIEKSNKSIPNVVTDIKLKLLGRDEKAVYASMKETTIVGEFSQSITAISAITLLKDLPLQITVYEGDGKPQSKRHLKVVLNELLNNLIEEN